MPAIEFGILGVALAQIIARIVADSTVADVIGDAGRILETGKPILDPRLREKSIAKHLEAQLRSQFNHPEISESDTQDFQGVTRDVATLVTRLATDKDLILIAARDPESVYPYVLKHGGQKIVKFAPAHAEQFALQLIRFIADRLALEATHNSEFPRLALSSLLRTADYLEKNIAINPSDDEVSQSHGFSSADVKRGLMKQLEQSRVKLSLETGAIIQRDDLLRKAVEPSKYPVAVVGDGGYGKSVLVGEIAKSNLDRAIVVISIASLDGAEQVKQLQQIDDALGAQATGLSISLTDALKVFDERPLLILDTLDILLRDETAPPLAELLSKWSVSSDLLVTCRSREWYDLLSAKLEIFEVQDMPSLSAEEVVSWSRKYMSHDSVSNVLADQFIESINESLQKPGSLRVLEVPLRLAMATRLYAHNGRLPEGLTATKLYKEYWLARVSTGRDGRRNTRSVRAAEEVALGIAECVWKQSTERFVEDLRYSGDFEAVNALVSDGIIARTGYRMHFFHQTFSEFAVARYLAASGEESDFRRFQDGLESQLSGYWGIASHLVHEELTSQRFQTVAEHIPTTMVEGVRVVLSGAFARFEPEIVQGVVSQLLDEKPDYVSAASDILANVPAEYVLMASQALCSLMKLGVKDLTAVVRAVALLIPRMSTENAARTTDQVLSTLISRPDDIRVPSELRRFLNAILSAESIHFEQLSRIAVEHYHDLSVPGRLAIIEAVCATEHLEVKSALISTAIRRDLPEGSVDAVASIICAEIDCSAKTRREGWSSWEEIASAEGNGRWGAVRARVIAHMAKDPGVRSEIVIAALSDVRAVARNVLLNALRLTSISSPNDIAIDIINAPTPQEAHGAVFFSRLAFNLEGVVTGSTRAAIIAKLRLVTKFAPRDGWATYLAFSGRDSKSLAEALREFVEASINLKRAKSWSSVLRSSVSALLRVVTSEDLKEQVADNPEFWKEFMMLGTGQEASIHGALIPVDTSARAAFDELVDSDWQVAQRNGLRELFENKSRWNASEWNGTTSWRVAMIRVRNAGALIALADNLRPDAKGKFWSEADTAVVANRLIEALAGEEDPQVSGALIALLGDATHNGARNVAPSASLTELIIAALWNCLEPSEIQKNTGRAGALYGQCFDFITEIAMKVLPYPRTTEICTDLMLKVDIDSFGGSARSVLSSSLGSVLRVDKSWWRELESNWPIMPDANRGAVADLALSGLVDERAQVAIRLARRTDCPPNVASDILRRLGGTL
ncbi:NACHT domain-containing protein [Mycetocola lacteus]|uniref:NACHT domain-containing protein n=1 Tax=Mycetocola lacteus TaxID=76637 RepID=A0A3L7AV37_9MICO|nr:NACHT domain-containing protein [Mycetocola lacteus]RLP84044.1 NACHT domain-containing protein [Mycetocola lacteus]